MDLEVAWISASCSVPSGLDAHAESGNVKKDPTDDFARLKRTVRLRGVREGVATVQSDAKISLIEEPYRLLADLTRSFARHNFHLSLSSSAIAASG
jgi:hypothetical protein